MQIKLNERREDQDAQAVLPPDLRRRVFGGLIYIASPLAPIAAVLLWRQFQAVGNLSSLWMAVAYALLSLALLLSVGANLRRHIDLAVLLFAYPAALLLSVQLFVSPVILLPVTATEMLLLASICFVVMEEEGFKLYLTVQAGLALAFALGRAWLSPQPLLFPAWDAFNRQVVPLAIFLVFQVAIIIMALQLRRLLAKNSKVLASLKLQREELARKNDDLRLFFYAASHDLRQPLRQVLGFAKLLEQRHHADLAPEAKEYLGFMDQVARRMEGLLDGLLEYSSLGAKPLELEELELSEPLNGALEALQEDFGKHQVRMARGDLPRVWGERELLQDVFRNLLDNGVKYRHPERIPELKLRSQELEDGWLITVDDNGIGVPLSVRPGLFQVFHRGRPPAAYPGYGIGLAYCRRVLELHGGWIRLAEKDEPGTRIEFFLPRVPPPQRALEDDALFISH